jgi:hypothetical protein
MPNETNRRPISNGNTLKNMRVLVNNFLVILVANLGEVNGI